MPLTLWRIPTFIILYSHHKDRKLFFSILGSIYEQMLKDLFFIPLKLLTLLIAPRMASVFIYKTSFKYGPLGLETFQVYQKSKVEYLFHNIIATNFRIWQILLQCVLIQLFWIRAKSLRSKLRFFGFTMTEFYRMLLFQTPLLSSMNELVVRSE